MQHRSPTRPIGLTQGDPAGIGPDVSLAAWARRTELDLPPFLYIGDPAILADRAREIGMDIRIRETDAAGSLGVFDEAIPVLPVPAGAAIRAGHPHPASASGTTGAIEKAVELCFGGEVSSITTNPIAKSVLYKAGFRFPGHTEYLADLASKRTGKEVLPVMMLAGPLLRAIPLTIHIPLKDVPGKITEKPMIET